MTGMFSSSGFFCNKKVDIESKVKSAYEPSGLSDRKLILVSVAEATRGISTPLWMGC